MLAQAHNSQLRRHVRALPDRLLTFLECRCVGLFLYVASLTINIENYLLCSKLFQRALHLLDVRPAVVLLLARRLRPQLVLLDSAQSVQSVL